MCAMPKNATRARQAPKGDVDSRMMSALLIGVNRAYPFTKGDLELISDHIETLYRVVHVACFNVSVHTLCLLFQVGNASNSISDRFYSVLYKKLADTQLPSSRHHAMFLSLLFKALKTDNQIGRTKAFVKRILQYQHIPDSALRDLKVQSLSNVNLKSVTVSRQFISPVLNDG
ncbi:unnamed protein product, partial [Timema podura]|nr:unnamed protein product [Timema podura]